MIVGIMMPHFGDVQSMREAVASMRHQDDENWRLTVVDDGLRSGISEWFGELNDPRVRYIRNDRTLGVTSNLQRCVKLADHDLVTSMGCDDAMPPRCVRGAGVGTPCDRCRSTTVSASPMT